MSKQSEAKARQGYNPKPVEYCKNCNHFVVDIKENARKRLRCELGGFAVRPNARCEEFYIFLCTEGDAGNE